MKLDLDQATAEYAMAALLFVRDMTAAESSHYRQIGGDPLRRGMAERRATDFARHALAFAGAVDQAREAPARPTDKDLARALNDVAALVEVALAGLSVEDYEDSLTGAKRRLAALIGQLSPAAAEEVLR